jgi:hypothetical protein
MNLSFHRDWNLKLRTLIKKVQEVNNEEIKVLVTFPNFLWSGLNIVSIEGRSKNLKILSLYNNIPYLVDNSFDDC